MLNYLTEVSLGLLLLYGLYILLYQTDTFHKRNRYFLLFGSVFTLVLPLVEFNFTRNQDAISGIFYLTLVSVKIEQTNSWFFSLSGFFSILTVIYLVIFLFLLLRLFFRLFNLIYFIYQNQVQYRRGYYLIQTEGKMPTFSFFNYLFWDNTLPLSEEEADKIINHEQAHIWDKHSFDVIFLEFLKVILWFHPVVYLLDKELRMQHEFIADDTVLKESDAQSYRRLLLVTLFKKMNISLVSNFNRSEIQYRLERIGRSKTPVTGLYKMFFLLPFLTLMILTFACREKAPEMGSELSKVTNNFANVEGGLDKFYKAISQKIKYPEAAKKKGVEGKVFIQFTVMRDGSLSNIKVIKGFDNDCDQVALEVVKNSGFRWIPAKVDGKAVKQTLTLPIAFRLDKKRNT